MASLLVNLHEVVENYVKKSANKELAGKLGSRVLESARDEVKSCMFDSLNALQYVSVKPMKILTREIIRINSILVRRMKPTPVYRNPWKVSFSRYMPAEVFSLLENCIQSLNSQSSHLLTRCTRQVEITDEEKLKELFLKLGNEYNDENKDHLDERQLLRTKTLRDGQHCKIIVSKEKPFSICYSNKREMIRITLFYGCWNVNGIPQHF